MGSIVKDEPHEHQSPFRRRSGPPPLSTPVIELSDSDSDGDGGAAAASPSGKRSRVPDGGGSGKKQRTDDGAGVPLPLGFLDPFPPEEDDHLAAAVSVPMPISSVLPAELVVRTGTQSSRQFWKAGDYEGDNVAVDMTAYTTDGMDHVRVHPKFLHSNATSHKWALGAFAELLDNALDEVCHGATYVKVDMLKNKKDGTNMLLVEDDGGGMDPDKMRQCMSLGYSAKSKIANTIGQYGNGFKTSTMRLGADVIVFSRCHGQDGKSPTQSIGMLSYTFLRSTGKDDIVVPMLDYEIRGQSCNKMVRASQFNWDRNLEAIVQWSPYENEEDLLQQFLSMKDQGTRIIIYSLWEDDQGDLELDFGADCYDIQIRGVNRDEKKIQMAQQFPNSRHFLTYRHSLRSYASILYLTLPRGFKITLRGKDVQHHNIVNDMMLKQEITYRPQASPDGTPIKDPNIFAVVTIGFVKDAKDHIDVQGFNVYHKNRLIKPFWRVWHAAGSDGRGVIGLLEANFIEPAHDKQGFERTTMLARLEARLVNMQKQYWSTNCHRIGYAPRRNKKLVNGSFDRDSSPETPRSLAQHKNKAPPPSMNGNKSLNPTKSSYKFNQRTDNREMGKGDTRFAKTRNAKQANGHIPSPARKSGKGTRSRRSSFHENSTISSDESNSDIEVNPIYRPVNGSMGNKGSLLGKSLQKESSFASPSSSHLKVNGIENHSPVREGTTRLLRSRVVSMTNHGSESDACQSDESLEELKKENKELKDRIKKLEALVECENDRAKSLDVQLEEAKNKLEEANRENEAIIEIFSEERSRRDREEENLRKKVKENSNTINELQEQLIILKKKYQT